MDPIFAELPADLASLSDDDLQNAIDDRVEACAAIQRGDEAVIGDRDAQAVIDEMTAGVEQIEALRAEQTERAEAREQAQGAVDELARRAGVRAEADDAGDGDDDGEGDGDEGAGDDAAAEGADDAEATADEADAAVEEPEPIAAAGRARGRQGIRRGLALGRSSDARPAARDERGLQTITASADVPGVPMGAELRDMTEVGRAMMARRQSIGRVVSGDGEKIPVARITRHYDNDAEILSEGQDEANWRKVQSMQALAASGGLCAPVTPYYDLQQIATDDRPVRDALARFNANRGGIRFGTPPTIADVTTGVGVKTAAQDAIGGTTAEKTCQHIECPDLDEVDVDMIYWCLQFGNLQSRTWPEQVAQFTALTMAAHAREAETVLLDGIKAASTQVTAASQLGYVGSLLGQFITAAVGIRSRHRMDPAATIRVLTPAWTMDGLILDLMRSQFQRFSPDRAGLVAFLRSQGIALSFYIDSATGDGMVIGAQGTGALINLPTTVKWYAYPEGSFLWLDGGTLDLGIVRDSTLNATNDYSIFGETFEEVAFVGVESLHVTSTVCPSGVTAGPVTVTCPVL